MKRIFAIFVLVVAASLGASATTIYSFGGSSEASSGAPGQIGYQQFGSSTSIVGVFDLANHNAGGIQAEVFSFSPGAPADQVFQGSLTSIAFNPVTGILTAHFTGINFFTGGITSVSGLFTVNFGGCDPLVQFCQGGMSSTLAISAVPEPGSLTLVGTGLLGLAGVLKRKLMS